MHVQPELDDFDKALPWHCFSNNFKSFDQHATLGDLCAHHGIEYQDARYAVKENNGNYGAYHIVHRT